MYVYIMLPINNLCCVYMGSYNYCNDTIQVVLAEGGTARILAPYAYARCTLECIWFFISDCHCRVDPDLRIPFCSPVPFSSSRFHIQTIESYVTQTDTLQPVADFQKFSGGSKKKKGYK